ncbi:MAG: asparagine synthase (glutamine-hydrolyzing), partial [Planctomycetes bacterium]|nr:asparagine synthase (glutamine-hydrolyzing) [Planctomycetota bacterium]
QGELFRSTGDTEEVLRCLSRQGPTALTKFNAMFALALWDEKEGKFLLARDRFGQKPLYYAYIDNLLIFSSEIRSLLASGLVKREIDPQGLKSYLSYGAVQGPKTIVTNVSLLSPAGMLEWQSGKQMQISRYWNMPRRKKECSPLELRDIFLSAVDKHMISDVPIGLFLSGGIDSSAIVAAAVSAGKTSVNTISVVFPDQPDLCESSYATQMSSFAGTCHQEIPVTGNDMLGMLGESLAAMDQPTGDAVNTYIVSHAARQAGLKVALSGLGGDELFGGYPAFRDVPRMMRWQYLPEFIRTTSSGLLAKCGSFSVKPGKLADFFDAPQDILSSYLVRRRVFTARQVKRIAPDLVNNHWDPGINAELHRDLQNMVQDRKIPDAVGLLEMRTFMEQTLLRDSDVMGMAHGLEIRLPFLDSDFAGCSISLPTHVRNPRAIPKWFFVDAVKDWLPEEIFNRPKRGFTLPFKNWMQKELKDEVPEGIRLLIDRCEAVEGDILEHIWERFCEYPEKVGWFRPWSLFVLGRFLEQHNLKM